MGMIQQSINNAINTASIMTALYAHSPTGQAAAENKRLNKIQKVGEKAVEDLKAQNPTSSEDILKQKQQLEELQKYKQDSLKKQFELNPTKKGYDKLTEAREKGEKNMDIMNERYNAAAEEESRQADFEEQMGNQETDYAQQAAAKTDAARNARSVQKKARRNFMDYLKNMETNLGGTVGGLPKDAQKQIAKNYSSSERRKIMNEADRQKGGNK